MLTIRATGPLLSTLIMAFPISESSSPCQILGILYFWATLGFGRNLMTMSRRTSWTGATLDSVFWSSLAQ